jgi:hypothetical protein
MDWLSVDYCSEIRNYILDYIATERRRVQQEINEMPAKTAEKIRDDGAKMLRMVNAMNPRIEVTG